MKQLAEYRRKLQKKPILKKLFLELTLRCNQKCLHCGSSCGDRFSDELTFDQYKSFLDKVKKDFDISEMQLCITGGEPLLRDDFFEIMNYANDLGYSWGMTSNATLIDDKKAELLEKSGMKTISVSIDGLRETHDNFRRSPGGFDKAVSGIKALLKNGSFENVQVTTVVHKNNINQLDKLFELMTDLNVDSWRITNIDPIGRARSNKDLLLDADEYRYILDYIRDKRRLCLPVSYGCSHYLGLDYEREVRDWYFLCSAGIYVASIHANGDISACLDIEPRKELLYGNILKDDFTEIWNNKFEIYRSNLSDLTPKCADCPDKDFCNGGSYHTWDYDKNEPLMCFKNILF